jgi:hypothetical protein
MLGSATASKALEVGLAAAGDSTTDRERRMPAMQPRADLEARAHEALVAAACLSLVR